MLKVTVWYVDENKDLSCTSLCNLKPRRYMCGWSFEQMIKYTKEELSDTGRKGTKADGETYCHDDESDSYPFHF